VLSWVWKEKTEGWVWLCARGCKRGCVGESNNTESTSPSCEWRKMHTRKSSKDHVQCSEITGERNTQTESEW